MSNFYICNTLAILSITLPSTVVLNVYTLFTVMTTCTCI